jgi:hypothetical protein
LRMKTSRILTSSTTNLAGVLRGSGLYNSLGRAGAPTLVRPSLCALSALRGTSTVLGAPAPIMGRISQHYWAPALRFAALLSRRVFLMCTLLWCP